MEEKDTKAGKEAEATAPQDQDESGMNNGTIGGNIESDIPAKKEEEKEFIDSESEIK